MTRNTDRQLPVRLTLRPLYPRVAWYAEHAPYSADVWQSARGYVIGNVWSEPEPSITPDLAALGVVGLSRFCIPLVPAFFDDLQAAQTAVLAVIRGHLSGSLQEERDADGCIAHRIPACTVAELVAEDDDE